MIDYISLNKTDFLIDIWLNVDHGSVLFNSCLATIPWFNKKISITLLQCKQPLVSRHIATPVPPFPFLNHSLQWDPLSGGCCNLPPIRNSADNSNWLCCHYLGLLYSCLYPGREIHDTHSFKAGGLCVGVTNWHTPLFMSFSQSGSPPGEEKVDCFVAICHRVKS